MTGEQFEKQFIEDCTEMTVTATLAGTPPYSPPLLWARDKTHHITAGYCGCDVKVYRVLGARFTYAVCSAHHLQPLGKSSRTKSHALVGER